MPKIAEVYREGKYFTLKAEKYHNTGMCGYNQYNLTWEEVGAAVVLLTGMGYSRFGVEAQWVPEDFSGMAKALVKRD